MTRLVIGDASGRPLSIADLQAPITFTLPTASAAAGQQVACTWWDATAEALSSAGCVALPSPSPAGHTLAFKPGFQAASNAALAGAWALLGPLNASCTVTLLDCAAQPGAVGPYLDPTNPFVYGRASCSAASPPGLLVFSGASCAAFRPDNAYGCYWNVTTQAWVGQSCLAATSARCMCR